MRWWERSRWSKTHPRLPDPANRKAEPDYPVPKGPHPELVLQGLTGRAQGLSGPDETNLQSGALRIALGLRIELALPSEIRSQAAYPSRGKGTPTRAPPTSPTDCLMMSPRLQPPSRAASSSDPRATPSSGRLNPVQHLGDDHFPPWSVRKWNIASGTPRSGTPMAEGASDSEEEIAPSPNTRRVLTRLQRTSEMGGSFAANSPGSHTKDEATQKKHRAS